jgi:hypothetical protein
MINRRSVLTTTGAVLAASLIPAPLVRAAESRLIYLSPFKTTGELSRCQAEVWYVQDGAQMFVVTQADAWRARAISQGLAKTQVWVGDVGQWQSSGGRYKSLPAHMAQGAHVTDRAEHGRVLDIFGKKYTSEWGSWGPRFENGLADGSRVLLKYTAIA